MSQAQLSHYLQRALAEMRAGAFSSADATLRQASALAPAHPDVLQLSGLAAKNLGRLELAVSLFQASLKALQNQPHVHHNLANTLAALGQTAEAETHYKKALALKPDYADAAIGLTQILLARADTDAARTLLAKAIAHAPKHAGLHDALGRTHDFDGNQHERLQALKRAQELAPGHAAYENNLARALTDAGDLQGAEAHFRSALRTAPSSGPARAGLADVLRRQRRNADAIAFLRETIRQNPLDLDAHVNLNDALWETGDHAQHFESYRDAIARHPKEARLLAAYAGELMRRDDPAAAAAISADAIALSPENSDAWDTKARALGLLNDFDGALAAHQRAAQLRPKEAFPRVNHCDTLLRAGRYDEAVIVARAAVALSPHDQAALSRLTIALRASGHTDYHHFADFERMVGIADIEPPAGQTQEQFLEELGAYLRPLHVAHDQPLTQSLRGGTQTFGHLFQTERAPVIQTLQLAIEAAVARFAAALPEQPDHPFYGRRHGRLRIAGSWSARLTAGGLHANHIHPAGWLSSAFYVVVPPDVRASNTHAGWLGFGQSYLHLEPWDRFERFIEPKPGRLALFPSYFWHGTIPFHEGRERMTVAFDVSSR